MLSLLLMLLSGPLASPSPAAAHEPELQLQGRGPDRLARDLCAHGGFRRIERREGPIGSLRNNLTFGQDDEVRRYLLLDRTVDGCPEPISYPLPDRQDGFIRELGASSIQPPNRRPSTVQPPRSSE